MLKKKYMLKNKVILFVALSTMDLTQISDAQKLKFYARQTNS